MTDSPPSRAEALVEGMDVASAAFTVGRTMKKGLADPYTVPCARNDVRRSARLSRAPRSSASFLPSP